MSSASYDELRDLHRILADALKRGLKESLDKGDIPSAALLEVARKFVHDHNIVLAPGAPKGDPATAEETAAALEELEGGHVPTFENLVH